MKNKFLLKFVLVFVFLIGAGYVNAKDSSYFAKFDSNGGYGLFCDDTKDENELKQFPSGYVKRTSTVDEGYGWICKADGLKSGTEVNFPASSSKMMQDDGYLLGWTKTVENGKPVCQGGDDTSKTITIEKDNKTTIKDNTVYYACYKENVDGHRYVLSDAVADGGEAISCGTQVKVSYCVKTSDGENYCFTADGRKLIRNKITVDAPNCDSNTQVEEQINETVVTGDIKECPSTSNKTMLAMTGTVTYELCYDKKAYMSNGSIDSDRLNEKNKELVASHYSCNGGYTLQKNSIYLKEENCNSDNSVCVVNYSVTCSASKPSLSVTSGIVEGETGFIKVKASSKDAKIKKYFVSEEYVKPTNSTSGWIVTDDDSFTIERTPGTYYIWVMDSNQMISAGVSGSVIDTVNSNTTLEKLALYDSSNNSISYSRTISYNDNIKSSKYVALANNISKDSNALADGFNPFDMEYKIEVSSPTISVYATLTSKDSSYVPGYEPRTVNLKYGVNTILIKIKNNEGKVRTYTILATRNDDRTSDNTLNELNVSVGDIKFNSNVTDYKINIPKNTNNVNVTSTISSDKAKYVEGYEPGNVIIDNDVTVKLIKVMSETGSTRTYVLTFVKDGQDVIKNESLQLSDLVVPGSNLAFESNVSNYSMNVPYDSDVVDLRLALKDDTSNAIVSYKNKANDQYKIVSPLGLGLNVGENFVQIKVINSNNEESYYRLTIIRKEFGLDLSTDTTLKDLTVYGHDIKFNPADKDYTVKIKQEKSLLISAVPSNNRSEVFIRGNDELTGFSTVRIKVVAEDGTFETYSIDIKKDIFNKTIEIASIVAGVVIIIVSSCIIILKKKNNAKKDYYRE